MGRLIAAALLVCVATVVSACGGDSSSTDNAAPASAGAVSHSPFAGMPPERVDEIMTAFNRGMGLMDQYRPSEAAAAFEEVVQLSPDWVTGRLNLGIALLNTNTDESFVRAEEALRRVIELDPDNPYAHYVLGILLRHLGRFDEARDEFARVLEIDPEDADAHYQYAISIVEEDPVAAREHLETTLDKIPHHESACYRLHTLLRKTGEREAASEMLTRFRDLKTSGAGVAREMRYGEMGRYSLVARAFEEPPIAGGPDSPPAFVERAAGAGLSARASGTTGWPGRSGADAAAFGPGVACADVDGDGDLDLYLPGVDGTGVLYVSADGKFAPSAQSGIDGGESIAAYFGDYDGDGDPDLFVTRAGANALYNNDGDGRFTDVTAPSGTAGAAEPSVGAAWADADHDGDLDLFVANHAAPNALWRNNGDGTFEEVAAASGVSGGSSASMSVLFLDVDDDRDLDLYVVNDGESNQLFLNDRIGRYREATAQYPGLGDDGPGLGALLGDVDANGRQDILLLRGEAPAKLFLQVDRGKFAEDDAFAALAQHLGGATGALLGDFDIDGDLDLVLLDAGSGDEFAHTILMNRGRGRFDVAHAFGAARKAPSARGAVAADINRDGMLELLVATADGTPELWSAPAPEGRHWLTVVPAQTTDDVSRWVNPDAVGLFVELKTGRRLQVASVSSASGYLGNPPPSAHFGLGTYDKIDYARLSWPDAVLQGELEVPADHDWRIAKATRKPSSCPILFSWDGERFAFVTDFLGVGGMGFFVEPGVYAPPDPTEDVRVPPELIAVDDGRYRLRIAEPLEEVTYLDELHLRVYDHPADWEVHPDERFAGGAPAPTGRPHAVAQKIFPVAAKTETGEDVLERVLRIDRDYVVPPRDDRFVGYAHDHWLELDFGDRVGQLDTDARIILYLYGWIEYTYSHVNYAAYQAGLAMQLPWIELPDGKGGWRVAVPDMGFPAGLPRMMTFDISDLPLREDGRLRLRTNMEVFWDQVFVGQDVAGDALEPHVLRPLRAELRYLGYPREYSPDGVDPTVYDYHRVDQGLPFKNLTGSFTRFGDVRPLLEKVDDQFVIMARGEEIALEFDATALPPLQPGWSRTVVLHTDGYCKDMDLYTAHPDAVEPLPYHAMENYPPAKPLELTDGYAEYQRNWNTRRIVGNRQ